LSFGPNPFKTWPGPTAFRRQMQVCFEWAGPGRLLWLIIRALLSSQGFRDAVIAAAGAAVNDRRVPVS
jgi:hypothetical protein